MMRFNETLHPHWEQSFAVRRTLHHERTEHQDLAIFENETFGRVMALDGVIQTTEGDEPFYHEMMAHVPILAHGGVAKVLIVGGGDGGMLREVLRHPGIAPTMVEIDESVVETAKTWLPNHSRGAFDDPRARVVIADGVKFVKESEERFDVIIVDSTDPIGPGEVLFTTDFYTDCRRHLTERGILVTQNGVPYAQGDEVTTSYQRLSDAGFPDVSFYVTAVPSYTGGFMTLGWASLDPENRRHDAETIRQRFDPLGLETKYYNPDIHVGSFALPNYVRRLLHR